VFKLFLDEKPGKIWATITTTCTYTCSNTNKQKITKREASVDLHIIDMITFSFFYL